MSEKDPFEKYDKLFDEQDKKHDQEVKDYRKDVTFKEDPSFDDFSKNETKANQNNSKQFSQALGIIISIVVGISIFRTMIVSSPTFFGSIIPIFIFIGIMSSIIKYFKNKR